MSVSESPYGNALERVRQRVAFLACGIPSPAEIEDLAAVVVGQSVAERRWWLKRGGREVVERPRAGVPLVHALAWRAFACRLEGPETGLHLARAAVQVAEALRDEQPLAAPLAAGRAHAWMVLANAQRIVGELEAAEASWARVDRVMPDPRRDPLLAGDVARLKGWLRKDQRRFDEAEALFREAMLRYEVLLGDRARGVSARIGLAACLFAAGRLEEAFWESWRAGERLDAAQTPHHALEILHNQVLILAELGRRRQALFVLRKARVLYHHLAGPVFRLRALWLKGRLHSGLQEWEDAAYCLQTVRSGFVARDMAYDAALAALDLALAYAHLRKDRQVRELAEQMYPVFVSQRIPREASATLLLFADAAQDWRATAELIARCIAELDALQRPGRVATAS